MKLKMTALPIDTRLGVYAEEQAEIRTFTLDMELEYDATKAIAEDALQYAIDYAELETDIREFVASRSWQLVETLVYETAKRVAERYAPVQYAQVTVHKPQAMRYAENVSLQAVYHKQKGE